MLSYVRAINVLIVASAYYVCTYVQVVKLMDNGPFYLETKFDGDRMQLHRQGNSYRFFSRRSAVRIPLLRGAIVVCGSLNYLSFTCDGHENYMP